MYVSIVSNSIWEMVCFLREDVFFRLGGDVGGGETIAFEILGASLICFLLVFFLLNHCHHCIRTDILATALSCGIGLAPLNVNKGCSLEI